MTGSPPNPWTADEDAAIVSMRKSGHSHAFIAHKIGRTTDGVRSRALRIKAGAPTFKPFTENDDLLIKKLSAEGYNVNQIASVMVCRRPADIRARQIQIIDYVGYSFEQFVKDRGLRRARAYDWLVRREYEVVGGIIRRIQSALDAQDKVAQRIAAAPPSTPCWRCGARVCGHTVAAWSPTQVAA